jgi:hypothetical protein
LKIEYLRFALRRVDFIIKYQKYDGAKRHP